jgi:DNA primase large subunit
MLLTNNKVTEYSADHIIATAVAPVNYPTPQDGEKSGYR